MFPIFREFCGRLVRLWNRWRGISPSNDDDLSSAIRQRWAAEMADLMRERANDLLELLDTIVEMGQ